MIGAAALAVVLAAALFAAAGQATSSQDAGGLRAIVHDADGGTLELALSENSEHTVSTSLGTNVVVVRDGAVYVGEADCGNQDCVHQGRASRAGQQIICLPHKLWIEVVAAGDAGGQMDVDAVPESGEAGGPGAAPEAGPAPRADAGGFDAVAR